MDNAQRRPLQIVRNTVKVVAQMDWLGYLTGVTRVISELAPSPVLSSVASIVLLILEPLEASVKFFFRSSQLSRVLRRSDATAAYSETLPRRS
jgi:hypothetical protein